MPRFTFCGILLFMVFNCIMAHAQDTSYSFRQLNVTNGLLTNDVNCIYRDANGFLWAGTTSGLFRYDGLASRAFTATNELYLKDEAIFDILPFTHNNIYIQTNRTSYIYNIKTGAFLPAADSLAAMGLPAAGLRKILHSSHLFFAVYDSAVFYQQAPGTKALPLLQGKRVSDACLDERDNLYILYNTGNVEILNTLKPGRYKFFTGFAAFVNEQSGSLKIFADRDGDAWLYKTNEQFGILHLQQSTGQVERLYTGNSRLNNDIVNGITQVANGDIWAITDHGGVNIISKTSSQTVALLHDEDKPASIAQDELKLLYKDTCGYLWIVSYKKGISLFMPGYYQFHQYAYSNATAGSLPANDILRVAEDKTGNLWLGTNGGGLLYYDTKKKTYKQFRHDAHNANSISNDVVVGLYVDKTNKLWIGYYYGGMDSYDGKTFTHFTYNTSAKPTIGDNSIWEIYGDSEDRLWIGTLKNGLNIFDRKTNQFYQYPPSDKSGFNASYVTSFTEDNVGNTWIGTSGGIFILKRGSTFFEYVNANTPEFTPQVVNTLSKDAEGNIWIGTQRGLYVYNQALHVYQQFTTAEGLPDNYIAKILQDSSGATWVSTHAGFARLTVTKNAGKLQLRVRSYNTGDGLQSTWFNDNAGIITQQGEIVFGGDEGFNFFSPGSLVGRTAPPTIQFTSFYLFNKTVKPGEVVNGRIILPNALSAKYPVTLRYNENSFSVGFTATDFGNTDGIKFLYMLEGFDKNWVTASQFNYLASYTNLGSGHYTLRVKAVNSDGVCTPLGIAVSLVILPPFWLTSTAYVIYACIIIAALYLARRRVLNKAAARFAIANERREAQRIQELHLMKIKFFTNVTHEIKTPLSLILSPVDSLLGKSNGSTADRHFKIIQRNARRLLQLVNQLLDFRSLEIKELNEKRSRTVLFNFIADTVLDFADLAENRHILLHTTIPKMPVSASCDYDKLERVLFNLLSNAFKFTPENGTVTVTARLEEQPTNRLVIDVKDTGIGMNQAELAKIFDRFYQAQVPADMLNMGTGIGLAITKEFVRLMHGEIFVSSEKNKGTCFTISIPVYEVAFDAVLAIQENTESNYVTDENDLLQPVAPAGNDPAAKQTVLVVEDNDDFRAYLTDQLAQYYAVITAGNGKKGWQQILAQHPDIVISDISMPVMDGFALCKKIKTDARTAGIPVVLLTAFPGEENQLEGFDAGATDFMHKPFNPGILLTRVRNILHDQKLLKDKFSSQVKAFAADVDDDKANEKFIRQVLESIEKNMTNPNYSVEELSKQVYLSRVHLYRKIFAITGKTPIEFIRAIRLQKAAQLLEKTQMTIAEIAYETGFSNPKVLAKYFKLAYGMLPSAYAAANRSEK